MLSGGGSTASSTGSSTFSAGTGALAPSIDYYSKLLSGDPTATAAAIAPTTSGIMSQYDTAYKNLTDGTARGGQRSGSIANLESSKASSVGNVIAGVQPAAAQGLAGLGTSLAGLGVAEQGVGNQSILGALQGLLGQRGQDIGYTEQQQQNNLGLGQALGGLLSSLIGGSKSSSGATGLASLFGG
jgi:hypothetical protein